MGAENAKTKSAKKSAETGGHRMNKFKKKTARYLYLLSKRSRRDVKLFHF
jgi:hypothetical protein